MKRRVVGIVVVLLVLLLLVVLCASFFMGTLIKRGVEKIGPTVTKVDVKLDGASLALFSGRGELRGLLVGNPEGFKSPSAISIGSVAVEVVPGSVFSDRLIVRSVKVLSPEITLEGSLKGNNLSKILDNIQSSQTQSGPSGTKSTASEGRKLQVDDFLITGGKLNLSLNLLGQKSATVPLPEIHLSGLGQGSQGITAAELSEKLLRVILENATTAATTQLGSLGKDLGGAAQNLSTGAVKQVEKVTKGLGDFLKQK